MRLLSGGVLIISLMEAQSYDMTRSRLFCFFPQENSQLTEGSICSVSVTVTSQWDAGRDEGTDTGTRGGGGGRRKDKGTVNMPFVTER